MLEKEQLEAEWRLCKDVILREMYPRDRMAEMWQNVHRHHVGVNACFLPSCCRFPFRFWLLHRSWLLVSHLGGFRLLDTLHKGNDLIKSVSEGVKTLTIHLSLPGLWCSVEQNFE